MNWKMKKIIIVALLIFASGILKAQYGCLAVFEKGPDDKVKIVRIFSVKCTVTKMDDDSRTRIKESVNEYMHLDGKIVYTAFYIPFGDFELGKKFTLEEYIPKKEAKSVRFIRESEEILLDQSGNVVASKVKTKPLGSLIVYFNNGTENYQWAICEVWGKTLSKSPGDIAKQCGGEGAKGGVKIHQWMQGYDWNAAEKVARKNSSQYALPGYYNWIALDDWGIEQATINKTGHTQEELDNINQGKQPDGEKIDFSKEDYVDNLPPATINKLKSYFKQEEEKLLAQGWVRFTSLYDYVPGREYPFAKNGRSDRSITIIVVADDTNAVATIKEKVNILQEQKLGSGKYMVYYDLYSPNEKREFNVYMESLNKSKIPFGVIAFKKDPTFLADLNEVLIDADKGFAKYRGGRIKNEKGKEKFSGKKSLGHLNAEVSFNASQGSWEYCVYTEWGDSDSDYWDKKLNQFLEEKEKQGQYIVRRRESADTKFAYIDVFDKDGNLVLSTEKENSGSKKNKWTFYEQPKNY